MLRHLSHTATSHVFTYTRPPCVHTRAAQVGPDGKLFGSVTSAEIAKALAERAGVSVDKKLIKVPDIKAAGSCTAEIALHKEVVAKVTVNVAAAA